MVYCICDVPRGMLLTQSVFEAVRRQLMYPEFNGQWALPCDLTGEVSRTLILMHWEIYYIFARAATIYIRTRTLGPEMLCGFPKDRIGCAQLWVHHELEFKPIQTQMT